MRVTKLARRAVARPAASSRDGRGRAGTRLEEERRGYWLAVLVLLVGLACTAHSVARPADLPSRDEVVAAMRKAVDFFTNEVTMQGAYHFTYTSDLSYGRSEGADTRTRIEVQRQGTPVVTLAFLSAYDATGESVFREAARESAHAYVQGQYCSGGWGYAIEFDPEMRKQYPYRADGACDSNEAWAVTARRDHVTTLDDNVTQAGIRVLMRVDRALSFKDEAIHEAVRYALDSLIKAQYANGAWPQRYHDVPDPSQHPVKRASYPDSWERDWPGDDYQGHYTFNDNSIVDMIDVMLEAARIYNEPRYRASAERGGRFILSAQMPDPQPGWAQQYDRDMHPAWARRFEPPSITGGESQGAMRALLMLYRETGERKYLEPLPRALAYYKASALPPTDAPSEIRQRACPDGTKYCLARFYELRTNKPLYITKGTRVTIAGRSTELIDGYELRYGDESVITHYGVLTRGDDLDEIEAEYKELLHADPATIRRPDTLSGLSPWSRGAASTVSTTTAELGPQVRDIIESMDERGAWVEEGQIGRANRVVSVLAATDMVLTLGDQILPVRENETLTLYEGGEPPKEEIIRSETFARNIETMSRYLTMLE
ncbi:MAG: hypothetical protein GEU99_13025 [Luteitalea sp.]|nr:hypothetical protein [Luteitalea sp.]